MFSSKNGISEKQRIWNITPFFKSPKVNDRPNLFTYSSYTSRTVILTLLLTYLLIFIYQENQVAKDLFS